MYVKHLLDIVVDWLMTFKHFSMVTVSLHHKQNISCHKMLNRCHVKRRNPSCNGITGWHRSGNHNPVSCSHPQQRAPSTQIFIPTITQHSSVISTKQQWMKSFSSERHTPVVLINTRVANNLTRELFGQKSQTSIQATHFCQLSHNSSKTVAGQPTHYTKDEKPVIGVLARAVLFIISCPLCSPMA